MAISDLVPADGSYEDHLAQIAAAAAPPLDAIQIERIRGLLGPALRACSEETLVPSTRAEDAIDESMGRAA